MRNNWYINCTYLKCKIWCHIYKTITTSNLSSSKVSLWPFIVTPRGINLEKLFPPILRQPLICFLSQWISFYFLEIICWMVVHLVDIPQFVYLLPTDGHLGCITFGAITNKFLWIFIYKSLVGIYFHFPRINVLDWNCWIMW